MEHFRSQEEFKIVFLMQDSSTYTEEISPGLIIEHVRAFKIPGGWEYRFLWEPWILRKYYRKYRPDLIEIGSPYWLPMAARWATIGLAKKPQLLGFWHADFPVTYVRRGFAHIHSQIGKAAEALAWLYARWAYSDYRILQASSCEIMARMMRKGLTRVHWIPLGVDTQLFHPEKSDPKLIQQLKAGDPQRLTIFFPHRLTAEKGVPMLLDAYPLVCEALGHEPALVFASVGPCKDLVEDAVKHYKHIRYIGFVKGTNEMARWYASTELGLALSAWETFGLSILESMASGQVLVGANAGAAREHIETAGSGSVLPSMNAQSLADAIVAIARKGNLRDQKKLSRKYAEQFTWDACFNRQKKLYLSLLNTPTKEIQ